jgi:hypothetical protein
MLISGLFVSLGEKLPYKLTEKIRIIGERISLGGFYKKNFKNTKTVVKGRFDLIELSKFYLPKDFTYLEFGVASGNSINFAKKIFEEFHVDFHGYDSFYGIPEAHHEGVFTGAFSTGGLPPNIEGIHWHIGRFEQTVSVDEDFMRKRKLIVFDADLYSSTRYLLETLLPCFKTGDLLYFDDLHIPNQERLALTEYLKRGLHLELLGRSREGRSALFMVKQK